MKQKYPAKILFSISMAIFGTIGVFTRLINLSSSEIALYRAVLAAIVIAIFLVLSKKNIFKGIKGKTLTLLFLSGAAMGFNWILLFEATLPLLQLLSVTISLQPLCFFRLLLL